MSSQKHKKAFLEAYDKHADAIYRHCYFRVYNRERAEEIVQETFMRTWEYIRAGRKVENLRALLYKIAINIVIDDSRKRPKQEFSLDFLRTQGFDPGEDVRDKLRSRMRAHEVLALLNHLDEKYREAVIMRYIDDLTPKEIAGIIGETANVVSVRIYRGVEKLRTLLKDA